MTFEQFSQLLTQHIDTHIASADALFTVACDKGEMYNLYLDSFPPGTNEIYRKRREYDCSCCHHFIKSLGNVVAIKDGAVVSIWDFKAGDSTFDAVLTAMSKFVHARFIDGYYLSPEKRVGAPYSIEYLDGTKTRRWDHYSYTLPDKFVHTDRRRSIADALGERRAIRDVFDRCLRELTVEAIDTALELIASNSLYRGSEWIAQLSAFRAHKAAYDSLPDGKKALYAWEYANSINPVVARIRNTSIGTLLIDISNGVELDRAVTSYEKIVAPTNYKRPKAIFTKKMLEDASKTITEMGYHNSLLRRYATLDDISVNNILFANRDAAKRIQPASNPMEMLAADVTVSPKSFSRVSEIPVEKFVSDVLPHAKQVEVFLENRHMKNMVSLIAPQDMDAPTMFKWNNGFGWAYTGNITDSDIKQNVEKAGGKTDGVLRFSIQWNDGDHWDNDDLDAHCALPVGCDIYFGYMVDRYTGGNLDVDIIHPNRGTPAVENITFPRLDLLKDGEYRFYVNCYNHKSSTSGFRAEIACNGETRSYVYNPALRNDQNVHVAVVKYSHANGFEIIDKLPSGEASVKSKEVWGLKTNQFVPVSVAMYSPNYWDEQTGIGNKHYFFMLPGCVNPESPNGMFNEYLKSELLQHKRVFEALGSKTAVADCADQLSGLGFSSTQQNDIVVRVTGETVQTLRVKF